MFDRHATLQERSSARARVRVRVRATRSDANNTSSKLGQLARGHHRYGRSIAAKAHETRLCVWPARLLSARVAVAVRRGVRPRPPAWGGGRAGGRAPLTVVRGCAIGIMPSWLGLPRYDTTSRSLAQSRATGACACQCHGHASMPMREANASAGRLRAAAPELGNVRSNEAIIIFFETKVVCEANGPCFRLGLRLVGLCVAWACCR